ncbi:restriction endonuclease subunit S [Methyloversatilis thermotolerans]|uniref:restriction endonuclease subunit S n=1 Tax=Methyloversatilis thermotolerans TaxID=1346290 RepID=UPI000361BD17|nr:restriction endonuclease subunit S [Methyloversatilis thermotolerans]
MNGWRDIKLKEVSEYVTVGFVGSMADQYIEAGVPFLRSLNIQPFRLNYNDLKYIPESFHDAIKKSKLRPGDVAIVRTGYPGTACVIPADLPDANCSDLVILRPGAELNPHYIAAVFNSSFGQNLVGGNLVGAAQQHFNVTVAKELKLRLPPRAEQDKIAAVLVGLNDLIANNQCRIALLESMAEEIYREWFVRMRFPGYETAAHERGMPLGWQASTAAAMVQVQGGGTPSTEVSQYWGGEIPFFSPKDSHDGAYCLQTEQNITELGLENCASRLFPKHTIFITARGTVGNLVLSGEPMAMNQSCYALVPKLDKKPYFVFAGLRCAVDVIKGVSNSGVFDNVVMDTFKIIPLVNPGDGLRDRYNEVAGPIYEQSLMLRRANARLRATRDALLPRLISGKLRVDALDIQFPPSMQPPPAEAAPRGEAIAR